MVPKTHKFNHILLTLIPLFFLIFSQALSQSLQRIQLRCKQLSFFRLIYSHDYMLYSFPVQCGITFMTYSFPGSSCKIVGRRKNDGIMLAPTSGDR
ncbi:MAG: hypothetical protein D3910_22040 [Candidatus Electrothrix sp. ATG2]|nr:hypothetical protein [Candidatus Electrothrix sp. ATG2]